MSKDPLELASVILFWFAFVTFFGLLGWALLEYMW